MRINWIITIEIDNGQINIIINYNSYGFNNELHVVYMLTLNIKIMDSEEYMRIINFQRKKNKK